MTRQLSINAMKAPVARLAVIALQRPRYDETGQTGTNYGNPSHWKRRITSSETTAMSVATLRTLK